MKARPEKIVRLPSPMSDIVMETRPRRAEAVSDGESFFWAVSFTDLLLVVMSFFILFFSFNDTEYKQVVTQTAATIAKSAAVNKEAESKEVSIDPILVDEQPVLKSIRVKLSSLKVTTRQLANNEMVVDFRDNLYDKAAYELSEIGKMEVEKVLKILSKAQNDLAIIFVGHTDGIPFVSKNGILSSNLVLSDLRASNAAQWAIEQGLNPSVVSTKGFAEFGRGTRSLSIFIRPKEMKEN